MTDPAALRLEPFGERTRSTVERLWQLYRHDLSGAFETTPDVDGRFPAGRLPRYFAEPDTPGFLMRLDGAAVGFCGVLPHEGFVSMGDFFVVRGLRRTGVGQAAALRLIRSRPGPWYTAYMLAITASSTCAVQMLLVAFSRRMCCSRVCSASRYAGAPSASRDTPTSRPGSDRSRPDRTAR